MIERTKIAIDNGSIRFFVLYKLKSMPKTFNFNEFGFDIKEFKSIFYLITLNTSL